MLRERPSQFQVRLLILRYLDASEFSDLSEEISLNVAEEEEESHVQVHQRCL